VFVPPPQAVKSDWRTFAAPRYRAFRWVGVGQGAVAALAGGAVTMPLLLHLGAPAAVAMAIGILPAIGSLSQFALPAILRHADGNLRGVCLLVASVADTRGFWLAAVVALAALGALPAGLAIAAIALVSVTCATLGGLSATTTIAWYHAVLPEAERRLVSPRVGTVASLSGVALLLPTAALLADGRLGLWAYVLPLGAAGLASLAGLAGLARLPRPGRVRVPARRGAVAGRSPSLQRYLRISSVGAFGFGIGPPLSIYAIDVLGLSPGYAVTLSAVGTLASLVASMVAATVLAHGSSSRLLRTSQVVRVVAMACGLVALPVVDLAPVLLLVTVALGAGGDAAGHLAGTERLLRLSAGSGAIVDQADYVARTSVVSAGAQVAGSAVVAVGSAAGPLPYAALFVASATARAVMAVGLEVSPRPRPEPRALSAPAIVVGEPGFEPGTSRI
jgi:hypothetical protein